MIKTILLLALAVSASANPFFQLLTSKQSTVSAACGGTSFSAGDAEKFEAASGMFCLSGQTFATAGAGNTTNLISQAIDQKVTGTYAMKITQGGTYAQSWFYNTITADADFTVRFYFRIDSLGTSAPADVVRILEIEGEAAFTGAAPLSLELRNNSGTPSIRMIGSTTGTGFNFAENTWYRIEVRYQPSTVPGGCTLNIFTVGSTTPVFTATPLTSNSSVGQGFVGFGCVAGAGGGFGSMNMWFDNVKLDINGGAGMIGPDE